MICLPKSAGTRSWTGCVLALVLLMAGCATLIDPDVTVTDAPRCAALEKVGAYSAADLIDARGTRIALAAARFEPPVAHLNLIPYERPPRGPGFERNPVGGAVAGAAIPLAPCAALGALGPLAFGVCAVVALPVAAAGAAVGAAAGAAAAVDDEQSGANERASIERQAYEDRRARVAVEKRNFAAAAEKVDVNRLLVDRVAALARQDGIGSFEVLVQQGSQSINAPPRFDAGYDHVLEFALIEQSVIYSGYAHNPRFAFGISAQGRLVRVRDNAVVRTYTTAATTEARNSAAWAADDGRPFVQAVDDLLGKVAQTAVDQWLAPVVLDVPPGFARLAVLRDEGTASSLFTAEITLDGCRIGELGDGKYVEIAVAPGRHIVRSEPTLAIGTDSAAVTEVALREGQAGYLEFYSYRVMPIGLRSNFRIVDANVAESKMRRFERVGLNNLPPERGRGAQPSAVAKTTGNAAIGNLYKGNYWRYRFVDTRSGRPQWRRYEIARIDTNSLVEWIEAENADTSRADHGTGAYLNVTDGLQFAPYYFAFQPKGATGAIDEIRIVGGNPCGWAPSSVLNTNECEIRVEFEGGETITVPAGTFEAQRVRVRIFQHVWGYSSQARSGVVAEGRFWFAPKVGRVVSSTVTYEVEPTWTETMTLESYATGPGSSRAGLNTAPNSPRPPKSTSRSGNPTLRLP